MQRKVFIEHSDVSGNIMIHYCFTLQIARDLFNQYLVDPMTDRVSIFFQTEIDHSTWHHFKTSKGHFAVENARCKYNG